MPSQSQSQLQSHKERERVADATILTLSDSRNEKKGKSRKRPVTDFPPPWKPSAGNIAHGQGLGFSTSEIDRAAGKFRGYYIAKGSQFANWDQAFNNWLDIEKRPPRNEPPRVSRSELSRTLRSGWLGRLITATKTICRWCEN
jgi:hypothetical protein